MNIAQVAFKVYNGVHWHASKFEKVDFLLVKIENFLFGVGNANERNSVLVPIRGKLLGLIRANG